VPAGSAGCSSSSRGWLQLPPLLSARGDNGRNEMRLTSKRALTPQLSMWSLRRGLEDPRLVARVYAGTTQHVIPSAPAVLSRSRAPPQAPCPTADRETGCRADSAGSQETQESGGKLLEHKGKGRRRARLDRLDCDARKSARDSMH